MGGETCQGKVTLARLRDQSRWIRAKMPTTLVNIDQPFFFSLVLWIVVSSPPNVVVERSNAEKATSADNVMDVPRINLHANSTK